MKVTQFNTNTTFKKYSVRAMSDSVREGGGGEEGERRGRGGGEEGERRRNMPYGLVKGPRDAS